MHSSTRIKYEHPTSDVLELALQGFLCQSLTRNMEDPTAPGNDHSW